MTTLFGSNKEYNLTRMVIIVIYHAPFQHNSQEIQQYKKEEKEDDWKTRGKPDQAIIKNEIKFENRCEVEEEDENGEDQDYDENNERF